MDCDYKKAWEQFKEVITKSADRGNTISVHQLEVMEQIEKNNRTN